MNKDNLNEYQLFKIAVGEKFPLFKESLKKIKGRDGAVFEANDLNQGYMFCIHFSNVLQSEINIIRKNPISMKIVKGNSDDLVLPLINFGRNLIFEMIFDPTLYDDDRALQFIDKNNLLTIYLIDSNTGIVKVIRQANFPLKMIQICKIAWSKAILNVNFSERYKEWINSLQQRYTLEGLWNIGSYVGKMGETYNLDEIRFPNYDKRNDLL